MDSIKDSVDLLTELEFLTQIANNVHTVPISTVIRICDKYANKEKSYIGTAFEGDTTEQLHSFLKVVPLSSNNMIHHQLSSNDTIGHHLAIAKPDSHLDLRIDEYLQLKYFATYNEDFDGVINYSPNPSKRKPLKKID